MAIAGNQVRQIGEAAIEIIERQPWLDVIGDRLQKAVAAAFAAGGQSGRRIRDLLHGTWLGHPLHPVLTDIPLGAWTAALFLDAIATERNRLSHAADAAIGVGLAGAAGAAVTGLTDWHHTIGDDRRLGLTHGLLNTGAVTLYVTALSLRRGGARDAGRLVAGFGFLVAIAAAYIGGHLVYRKRIGVDHAPEPDDSWRDFVAVLPDSELEEARPQRVKVGDLSLVLVRQGGQVYALVETCAHLGGPLAEGSLEGAALRCPWHGSLFALVDGRVLEGPSTYPQPCFEVRTRAGQIEVRARR
jgi:nitrite reductase/ring-hydroxylating ferredoxin subunit/uncharacterized membrane protein